MYLVIFPLYATHGGSSGIMLDVLRIGPTSKMTGMQPSHRLVDDPHNGTLNFLEL